MKKKSSQNKTPSKHTKSTKTRSMIPKTSYKNLAQNPLQSLTQAPTQNKQNTTQIPNTTDALPSEIIATFEAKDFNRCIALCTAFLQKNPSAPQVWFICGMSLYYLANIPRAIESLQIALTLSPNNEQIAFNLAEILRQNGNALSAIEILNAFVPCKNGDVYYNLARALTTQAELLNAKNIAKENNSPKMTNLANLTTSQNRKSAQLPQKSQKQQINNTQAQSQDFKQSPAPSSTKSSAKSSTQDSLSTQTQSQAQHLDSPLQKSLELDSLTNPQYFINPYNPPTPPHPQAKLLLSQAKIAYKTAIELNPLDKDAIYNLANLHAKDKQYSQAIALYEQCGTLNAKLNLAFLYNQIDEGKKACAIYAALESGFAKECGFLPLSIDGEEFDKDALDSYFRSNILPNMPKTHKTPSLDDTISKIASYKSHLHTKSSKPEQHISQFYFNYANTARYAGFNMLSFYLYGCAYCLDSNALCAINYAHLALSLQNFSLGFKLYEERLALDKADAFNSELFALPNYLHSLSGTPQELQKRLKGTKVLIFGEQGLGDMIMFGRFIDTLKSKCQCEAVYVYVRDELKSLFALRYEVVESEFREFDYCVSAMSLAYILGVESLSDFSTNQNYLAGIIPRKNQTKQNQNSLDKQSQKNIESSFAKSTQDAQSNACKVAHKAVNKTIYKAINNSASTFKVGFFFASTSGSSNAKDKSIPLDFILDILFEVRKSFGKRGVDLELHCLQPESLLQKSAQEISKKSAHNTSQKAPKNISSTNNDAKNTTESPTKNGVENFAETSIRFYDLANFLDTAKVMSGLDIVISIDSAPAHLAIALGIPCVVVAHKRYDWRWEEIGKNISLQERGIGGRFSGLCGGEVLAQGKNGEWIEVGKALKSYLENFIPNA